MHPAANRRERPRPPCSRVPHAATRTTSPESVRAAEVGTMVCCFDSARGVSTPPCSSTDSTTVNGCGAATRTSQLPATSGRPCAAAADASADASRSRGIRRRRRERIIDRTGAGNEMEQPRTPTVACPRAVLKRRSPNRPPARPSGPYRRRMAGSPTSWWRSVPGMIDWRDGGPCQRVPKVRAGVYDPGQRCGMAGSFDYERGHCEVSRACGERVLFPVVRGREPMAWSWPAAQLPPPDRWILRQTPLTAHGGVS